MLWRTTACWACKSHHSWLHVQNNPVGMAVNSLAHMVNVLAGIMTGSTGMVNSLTDMVKVLAGIMNGSTGMVNSLTDMVKVLAGIVNGSTGMVNSLADIVNS